MEKRSFRIVITNSSKNIAMFRLEPWGDEKELLENQTVVVNARGPSDGTLEVEFGEKLITVYGWPGSICEIEES